MIVIKSPIDLEILLNKIRGNNKKIGFAATMGALHDGHISLIKRSKEENDTTVCSIFINPKQFNDSSDLEKYPRPIENDLILLKEVGADIVFLPDYNDIYPQNYIEPEINLSGLDNVLEGLTRPGHFKGVALVVKRLFECVNPDVAYFGQKDYQQTLVIKEIVKQFKIPSDIAVCSILREKNGLAMSSRNIRLSAEQRERASFIYKMLLQLKEDVKSLPLKEALNKAENILLKNEGVQIDYLTIVNQQTLVPEETLNLGKSSVALVVVDYFGVRLLDNIYL